MSALDSMQSTRSVFTVLSKSCEKVLMRDSLNLGKCPIPELSIIHVCNF